MNKLFEGEIDSLYDEDHEEILDTCVETCPDKVRIIGEVSRWDGLHKIVPTKCDSFRDALEKCFKGQDYVSIRLNKKSVSVYTNGHDNPIKPSRFIIRAI